MRKIFALFAIAMISISMQVSAKEPLIKIKKGMPYIEARKILLDAGWQTVTAHTTPNGTPVCFKVQEQEDESLANSEACNYEEIDSCSGSGMGFCEMIFFDGEKTYLSITTDGGEPPEAEINSWRKVKKKNFESTVTQDSSPPKQDKKIDKKFCEKLLGAGMYNGILEDICSFNGGVKSKILNMYNEAGCRSILPQKVVNKMAKDVLTDTRGRYKAMGHNAFCNGNIDAYNALQ
jgi:hypothetical protein